MNTQENYRNSNNSNSNHSPNLNSINSIINNQQKQKIEQQKQEENKQNNDPWNQLLESDEAETMMKKQNVNLLGNMLDISNILNENNIKEEENDDIRDESIFDTNFIINDTQDITSINHNNTNIKIKLTQNNNNNGNEDDNKKINNNSNSNGDEFDMNQLSQQILKSPSKATLGLEQYQQNNNILLQNQRLQQSPTLQPQLQLSQKKSSYRDHGYIQIMKNQKGQLEQNLNITNNNYIIPNNNNINLNQNNINNIYLTSNSQYNLNSSFRNSYGNNNNNNNNSRNNSNSKQNIEIIDRQSELRLPQTSQNLHQNVHSYSIGINQLTNLNNLNQRKILYDVMKSFLELEFKSNIITQFDDLSYSSTGISFNTASYREGEKGMRVIVSQDQEMENKVNYIIDEESSLTEYCDLQLFQSITYIIDHMQESTSSYLKKLIVIVTEKPKTSFRKFLNKKMEQPKQFSEEQFRGSIRKLIRNVLFRHDSCIATKSLNPYKISCLLEHRIVVTDLGESIVEKDLDIKEGDTFICELSDYHEPMTVYSSPEELKNISEQISTQSLSSQQQSDESELQSYNRQQLQSYSIAFYDPFKSEIFSLGKIILEICLIKYQSYFMKKYSYIAKDIASSSSSSSSSTTASTTTNTTNQQENQKEGLTQTKRWIQYILQDNDLSYKLAGDLNEVINEIIIGKLNTQYFFKNGTLRKLRLPNVLQQMLELREEDRISSIKLALLTRSEKLLIKNRIQDPYPFFFPGQMCADGFSLKYPIRKLLYEGEIDDNTHEKHRKGLIKKYIDSEQESRLIVEFGQFHKGTVNGQVRMFIFQEHWKVEGGCMNNCIHGNNTILYKGQEIFKGYFSNFILNEWYDIDKTDQIVQTVSLEKEVTFQIENDISIKVNNHENSITCWNDKSFSSLQEFSSLYESGSLSTFKKLEVQNCGSGNKLEEILKSMKHFIKIKIENTFVDIQVLLNYQTKLQQIEISNCAYLNDNSFISLLSHNQLQLQLKKLSIDSNINITLIGLKHLAQTISNFSKLQYLSLKKIMQTQIKNQFQDKIKLDEISSTFIQLLQNSFHIYFLILDQTSIKDIVLEKVFENKKQTQIRWQYLSLNYCDNITKDGLRCLFSCKQLTELKKIDLMNCSNPKFDVPSKNLKICPKIINLGYSHSVTGNQLEKFIARNTIVSQSLEQISINSTVLDSKARDGFKKITNILTIILCIKEVSKIPADLCLDILSSIKNSSLYITSNKPIHQNEVNLTFSSSSSKSHYAKKIKFNKWKDGEFLADTPPSSQTDLQNNPNDNNISPTTIYEIDYDEESEQNNKILQSIYKKRNKTDEYKKDGIKLLGFYDYRNEETIYSVRVMTRIFNNANMLRLNALDVSNIDLDLKSLLILTYTPYVRNIITLDLSAQHITDQIIQDFTLSPYFTSLRTIVLKRNNFTIQGINLLLQAETLQLECIVTDKQSLSEDDLFHISNENLSLFKIKLFAIYKNIEQAYCSPVEIKESSNSMRVCQIYELNNTNNLVKPQFVQNFSMLKQMRILKLNFSKTKGVNDLILQTLQSCKLFDQLCDLMIDLSQIKFIPSELEQISGSLKQLQKLEILTLHCKQ